MKRLISQGQIQATVAKLAKNASIKDGTILLGILDGCIPFLSDLMFQTKKEIEIKTVRVNSYFGNKQTIIKNIDFDWPLESLKKKDVIIVDDIFDTGNTIREVSSRISPYIGKLSWCCLLKRKSCATTLKKTKLIPGSIIIPDSSFVVGYGLDYNGKYRNLKDIYRLEQ